MASYNKALLLSMCSKIRGGSLIKNLGELTEDQLKDILRENGSLRFKEMPILAMKWFIKAGASYATKRFDGLKAFIDPNNIEVKITHEEYMCLLESNADLATKTQNIYLMAAMNIAKDLLGNSLSNLADLTSGVDNVELPQIDLQVKDPIKYNNPLDTNYNDNAKEAFPSLSTSPIPSTSKVPSIVTAQHKPSPQLPFTLRLKTPEPINNIKPWSPIMSTTKPNIGSPEINLDFIPPTTLDITPNRKFESISNSVSSPKRSYEFITTESSDGGLPNLEYIPSTKISSHSYTPRQQTDASNKSTTSSASRKTSSIGSRKSSISLISSKTSKLYIGSDTSSKSNKSIKYNPGSVSITFNKNVTDDAFINAPKPDVEAEVTPTNDAKDVVKTPQDDIIITELPTEETTEANTNQEDDFEDSMSMVSNKSALNPANVVLDTITPFDSISNAGTDFSDNDDDDIEIEFVKKPTFKKQISTKTKSVVSASSKTSIKNSKVKITTKSYI